MTTNQVSLAKVREDERHNRALEPLESRRVASQEQQAAAAASQAASAARQAEVAAGQLQQTIAHQGVQESQGWVDLQNKAATAQGALLRGQAASQDAATRSEAEQRAREYQDATLLGENVSNWARAVRDASAAGKAISDMFVSLAGS